MKQNFLWNGNLPLDLYPFPLNSLIYFLMPFFYHQLKAEVFALNTKYMYYEAMKWTGKKI